MSIVNTLPLESNRQIKINFDGGDLSSDAGLLPIKEFVSKLGIDKLLGKAFKTNDSALSQYPTNSDLKTHHPRFPANKYKSPYTAEITALQTSITGS